MMYIVVRHFQRQLNKEQEEGNENLTPQDLDLDQPMENNDGDEMEPPPEEDVAEVLLNMKNYEAPMYG